MPSPFPGMDPYLERHTLWPDVHLSLITAIRDALAPQVAPGYYVRLEQRTYIVEREGCLEIHDTRTHEVVTAIEVLSPTNKASGDGRREYEEKRRQVLLTRTNLVEVDLLRGGEPMKMDPVPKTDYRVLVARGWERWRADVYAFNVSQPVPQVAVPLRQGEQEAQIEVGVLLAEVYDRARYDLSTDYRLPPPEPALTAETRAWVDELLRAAGLRG